MRLFYDFQTLCKNLGKTSLALDEKILIIMTTTPASTTSFLSYEMFEVEARAFFAISQDLLDEWELKISPDECQIYLQLKKQKSEYHIIYSVAFGVPVLYFRRFLPNGEILWNLEKEGVTQMPHPFFQTPFYQIHPCHTEKWMFEIISNSTRAKNNYLVTWLSFIAPYVGLNISEKYVLK